MCACGRGTVRPLTTSGVAHVLGTSANYVREIIEAGELAAIEIGRAGKRKQYRVPVWALRQYIAARRTTSLPWPPTDRSADPDWPTRLHAPARLQKTQ